MFEKLKRKIKLKKLEDAEFCELKKIRFCKAEIYDIEHDLCIIGKDWIIQKYGSLEAYKQHYEDWINESNEKIKEYFAEEENLRGS
jgi:hypothetical protein